MTLADLYLERWRTPSDVNELMPVLSSYATSCIHITEFGIRHGNSTLALLNGLATSNLLPGILVSYDRNPPGFECPVLPSGIRWDPRIADTSELSTIAPTDMLFIDTLHTAPQVEAELRQALWVRRWIIFHDTMLFGSKGENGQTGIIDPIFKFLASHRNTWQVWEHYPQNNGLLILGRT